MTEDDAVASAGPPAMSISPPADPSPPPRAYPTIGQAVVLLLLFGLITVVGAILVAMMTERHSVARFLGSGAFLVGTIGFVTYVGFRRSGEAAGLVFPLRQVPARFERAVVVLLTGALLLSMGLTMGLERVWARPATMREMERRFLSGHGSLASAIVVIAVLGPIAEELLFRGLILRGFLRNYGTRKAILASAVLFALYHLNPWQMPGALVIGIVFGVWRVGTGSLWPSILGHVTANGVAILASAAAQKHPLASAAANPDASVVAWILASALLLLGLGARLWSRAQLQET